MAAGSNLWVRANGVATFIVASGEQYQWQLAAICGRGPMVWLRLLSTAASSINGSWQQSVGEGQ